MEIRVLKYFLTVANVGNITKAASILHLTQPTLSRQLMDLEGELQQKLFSRGNRKIELTPEGVILKKRAEEVIELIEKAENELKSSKNEISGNIFIGSGETRAIKLITDIIKNLKTKYPKIKPW